MFCDGDGVLLRAFAMLFLALSVCIWFCIGGKLAVDVETVVGAR